MAARAATTAVAAARRTPGTSTRGAVAAGRTVAAGASLGVAARTAVAVLGAVAFLVQRRRQAAAAEAALWDEATKPTSGYPGTAG